MKLEEAKRLQNMFKSNVNEIPWGKYKSEEPKSEMRTIKLLYESRVAVIKLYLRLHTNQIIKKRLKILSLRKMLQRLSIVLAQVKSRNRSDKL